MEQLSCVDLEFREGTSDKVYNVAVEKVDKGYVVDFVYGRRSSTLTAGTKTTHPVTLEEAEKIFTKLVHSKTVKGYTPVAGSSVSNGIGSSIVEEKLDTGLRPQLLNPITEEDANTYILNNNWCAQEKFDGKRMMLRKSGEISNVIIVAGNRKGFSIGFPDTIAEALKGVPGNFILDGEVIGEVFYAFDLLENAKGDLKQVTCQKRLEALEKQFSNLGEHIVIVKTIQGPENKIKFMKNLRAGKKEGIVFKDLQSKWYPGRPASGGKAIKCKFWESCSCIVSNHNKSRSVEISLGVSSVGNVTIPPNYDIPDVGKVIEVRYLYVADVGGALYQPIYLGERDDISVSECTIEKQHLKYKAVV